MRIIDTWPFQPLAALPPDQQKQWIEQCYVYAEGQDVLLDPQRSVVVVAASGSGLSTSLAWIQFQVTSAQAHISPPASNRRRFLTFNYAPDQWPGQQYALVKQPDHFSQFMGQIAQCCMDQLKAAPDKLIHCPMYLHEFLIWLARHYLGATRGNAWLRTLERVIPDAEIAPVIEQARHGELDNLHSSDEPSDLYDQINACLDLLEYLGWSGAYALIDVSMIDWIDRNAAERQALREGIEELLRRLTPLQRPGFGYKLGIPEALMPLEQAQALSRNRATTLSYRWTLDQLWAIGDLQVAAASGRQIQLQTLLSRVWATLEADIHDLWGRPCPATMNAIAKYLVLHPEHADPITLSEDVFHLRKYLYTHYARLRRDPDPNQNIIWRGSRPIDLDDAQMNLFDLLWKQKGDIVPNEVLHARTGSSSNADQIISRLRQAIEPFGSTREYLYLQRVNRYGANLEKASCSFG